MPNRLVHETSPYLQQHAGNLVDWFLWGEEALQCVREQDSQSCFPSVIPLATGAMSWRMNRSRMPQSRR